MALNAARFGGAVHDAHKEQVILHWWRRNFDTAMISEATEIPESECANILARFRDRGGKKPHWRHRLTDDERQQRNRRIIRLYQDGASLRVISAQMNLSMARIHQIVGDAGFCDRVRRDCAGVYTDDKRVASIEGLYRSGLCIAEIAAYEEISSHTVWYALGACEGYVPRVRVRHLSSEAVLVPSWVPTPFHPRFAHLARLYGEDVAASCARFAKKIGLIDILPGVR